MLHSNVFTVVCNNDKFVGVVLPLRRLCFEAECYDADLDIASCEKQLAHVHCCQAHASECVDRRTSSKKYVRMCMTPSCKTDKTGSGHCIVWCATELASAHLCLTHKPDCMFLGNFPQRHFTSDVFLCAVGDTEGNFKP